ncbi:uncharacterized protein [Euwallacea similis]|uniref:uncharacterized protein n=1 Tax=Euwallacea similis TaxID=1736056 RepID=UPI00344C5651
MASPPLNDRYGPLLTQHLRAILESGLLLDEDYEVLLNACNFKIYPTNSGKSLLGIIAGSMVVIGSTFVAWKYNKPVFGLAPLAATVLFYLERKVLLKRKRQQAIVSCVIKSFQKVRKLNIAITRYFKMRKAGKSTKENENLLVSNENVQEFVKFFLRRNVAYLKGLLGKAALLANSTQEISDDFNAIKTIPIGSLSLDQEANSEVLSTRIQDVSNFLSSKYLNYLGLTLSNSLEIETIERVLKEDLPDIQRSLENLHKDIQEEFNNLKFNMTQKLEIDAINKSYFARQFSGKLQQTLIGAVNNLSIIMEKSHVVLRKVEQTEENSDMKKLEGALKDLRDHAFATYESLDVLCRLYGVLSDSTNRASASETHARIKIKDQVDDEDLVKISYEDEEEAMEEDYELFIPASAAPAEVKQHERYEDQSGMYLSLMMKELRQALNQHDRFIEARKKRGIVEEEVIRRPQQELAKFDLSALTASKSVPIPPPRASKLLEPSLQLAKNSSVVSSAPPPPPLPNAIKPPPIPPPFSQEVRLESSRNSSEFLPPPPSQRMIKPLPNPRPLAKELPQESSVALTVSSPPPPPLPHSIRPTKIPLSSAQELPLGSSSDSHGDDIKRTLLDDIRNLSSQLKGEEEVFGDDCDSDSD